MRHPLGFPTGYHLNSKDQIMGTDRKTSVLVVEPLEDCRESIRDLFSKNMPEHYRLHLANSYAAARSMLQRESYDVCIAPSRVDEEEVTGLLSEVSGSGWKIPVIILPAGLESKAHDGADRAELNGAHSFAMGQLTGNFLERHIRLAMEQGRGGSAVREAKIEWEYIFDAIPDPIAIIDKNYLFRRVNKAMGDRLGVKPGDLRGRACYEAVHGLSAPPDFCPLSLMLKDGQEHSAEVYEKNFNGVFLVSVSPFFDDENNLAGGIHVARDITRLKATEEQLRESNEGLERHVEMRTSELIEKAKDLEEANIALKVLLKHRELDRAEIQESVTLDIKELVFSYLDRMEIGSLSKEQFNACIQGIRRVFDRSFSSFITYLSSKGLSPTEIRIAEMIKGGRTNKEIADSMSISDGTVRTHRERIRNKLRLTNQKTNLQTYLQSAPIKNAYTPYAFYLHFYVSSTNFLLPIRDV